MFLPTKVTIFRTQKIFNFLYMIWYMEQYQFLFVLNKGLAGICKGIKEKGQLSH